MKIIKNTEKFLKNEYDKFINYTPTDEYSFELKSDEININNTANLNTDTIENKDSKNEPQNLFNCLDVNLEIIESKYNTLINSDIIIRNFILNARNKQYKAFIIYIDGLADTTLINDFILRPLILLNKSNTSDKQTTITQAISSNICVKRNKHFSLTEYINNCLIPQNAVKTITTFDDISSAVNMGNCVLVVDTLNIAFDLDVKGYKQRSIEAPGNEAVIRGSQEGFNEVIRTNTSLLRRLINNENLIFESVKIGKISKTHCALCYIKGIADPDLVQEAHFRLNNIEIDYLISSGQLEQLIEDSSDTTLPQLIATERPDKTANHLLDGRIAIIVNGSPYVLIAPRNI